MTFEQLPAQLKEWLQTMHASGATREATLHALLTAKYEAGYANQVVAAAYAHVAAADARRVQTRAAAGEAGSRTEGTGGSASDALDPRHQFTALSEGVAKLPNALQTSDRAVEMLFVIGSPRVVLFGNLLSDEECDGLISLSREKVQPSSVVNASTGAYDIHPHRTSAGTHFQRGENALVQRIERRIAELVDCPLERGEPLQVLNYLPGGEYKPHYDYFDPAHSGNRAVLANGGQRTATLIMYLNDVTQGGSTIFPEIGLDVLPRRGNAVYFAYCDEDGALDSRTLHGGSPVTKGEKWIATKWFRQTAYGGPGA